MERSRTTNREGTRSMSELLARLNAEISDVINAVLPSTATISGDSMDLRSGGSGSAWVFDVDGHLVTNNHVVEGLANPVKVHFPSQPQRWGTVVGRDPLTDLAVVKVQGGTAPPLQLRNDPATLGEICFAIGTPLDLPQSATFGIVSGVARQSRPEGGEFIEELIQTDAAVNPGNSGGPLIDHTGRVLGVNVGSRGGTATLNFSIPAEIVRDVVPELIEFRKVRRASIGITISTRLMNFDDGGRKVVEIVDVRDGSSPLRPGDLLLGIDGQPVERRLDVRKLLTRSRIDTMVKVHVARGEETLELDVFAVERT